VPPIVRPEIPADRPAIQTVNAQAFAGMAEAALVDRLRDNGDVLVSLIAEASDRVVGHVLFSRMHIDTANGIIKAAALAPMAVLPEYQNRGIGSALIRAGLEACRSLGETIVVVVGHQNYYPRFGFSPALARQLTSPYSGDSCMALELQPDAMKDVHGVVRYAPAFSEL
jgi:putative acetyltransferase